MLAATAIVVLRGQPVLTRPREGRARRQREVGWARIRARECSGSGRLGFCDFGEAEAWLDGGRRIALDGELPVNPHGGQLSEGRTHGFGFIYEAVAQLRGEADARQVANAKTAVVSTGGGTPSGVLLLQSSR